MTVHTDYNTCSQFTTDTLRRITQQSLAHLTMEIRQETMGKHFRMQLANPMENCQAPRTHTSELDDVATELIWPRGNNTQVSPRRNNDGALRTEYTRELQKAHNDRWRLPPIRKNCKEPDHKHASYQLMREIFL